MKYIRRIIFSLGLTLLCSCALSPAGQSLPVPSGLAPDPLALPIGKNWQVTEEPPRLSDEHGRLQFQTEQSLAPEGTKSADPGDKRRLETTR